MNSDASPSNNPRAAHAFFSAPFIAPTAQMVPESASPLGEFGVFEENELWALDQPEQYADNGNDWFHGQGDTNQPLDNVSHEQLHPGWPLPEDFLHMEASYQHLAGSNAALETPSSFAGESAYPPVGLNSYPQTEPPASAPDLTPAPLHTPMTLYTPAPDEPEGGNAVYVASAVDTVKVLDRSLVAKEKQARAVIRTQRNEKDIAKQMGKSVSVIQTATGVKFRGVYWTAPANDETIPTSDAEIIARVDTLARAMQNIKDCREKTTTGQYRNRWSLGSSYYSEDHFKAAACELVEAMIGIHRNGWTKPIYDKGERENCQMTMFYTFEDRFETLRELLHCSKTTCQDILKGNRFHTIIGNPRVLIFRTATNKTANVHKAELIAEGKKSLSTEDSEKIANSEENPAGGQQLTSEERSESEASPKTLSNPEKSSEPKKLSKGKKRSHEDVFVAEQPSMNLPRPKVAAKKPRKA